MWTRNLRLDGCGTHRLTLAALLAGAGLLAACTTPGSELPTVFESARTSAGNIDRTLSGADTLALLQDLTPFADMAEAVYRRDLPTAQARLDHGCDYVASGSAAVARLGLPEGWVRLDRNLIARLGMEAAGTADPLRPCRSGKGLDYETYVRLDEQGRALQAAISFRGTENTKYQWSSDWIANFSNVDFGLGANAQFAEAREQGARLVKALGKVLPKVASSPVCQSALGQASGVQAPIDLVGHSLGGGLAQHLAYYSQPCEVRRTVTFDSSPATGWFYLHWRGQVATADPDIARVYLDGEALSFVRKVSTKFNAMRNARRDYRIAFPGVSAGAFGRHSMNLLASGIKIAAGSQQADAHGIRVDYASTTVYPEVASTN